MIRLAFARLPFGREEEFDPNTVTPGVVGFVFSILVAAFVVLLAIDMVRRVRRVRYREEITERLDAEEAEATAIAEVETALGEATPGSSVPPTSSASVPPVPPASPGESPRDTPPAAAR